MGTHRYKVFGLLEVAGKTGRTETNGASGAIDGERPWDEAGGIRILQVSKEFQHFVTKFKTR
jgi:hypothetical protein